MRLRIAFSIVGFAIGINSHGFAGPTPTPDNSTGINQPAPSPTGVGTTSATAGGATPAGTSNESNTYEQDDALYRGKTSDSENPMMRDDGRLHFKTLPKEKIHEVDSLKALPSSGTDPKFQGSLLNSGVLSIESVASRPSGASETKGKAPRYKTKQLSLSKSDEPTKAEPNSTPSPTASPTASPTTKDSKAAKQ
jgi:hypothetical protein